MTVQEIIIAALQELGIIPPGSVPGNDVLTWGMGKFNRLLKSLSADGINLPYRVEENFPLVIGTSSYTIGVGAVFDTARPNQVEQAFIRDASDHDFLLSVRPIQEYWDVINKDIASRPVALYYDPQYPLGIIYFYYTPAAIEQVHIVSQKPLTTYVALNTEVSLPGEYESALILNLAVNMSSHYGRQAPQELILNAKAAHDSLLRLRASNLAAQMKPVNLNIPGTRASSSYNIDADQ